jgi:FtsP/CotA-like multicopper oxidase with cupredoxin domain
MATFNVTGEAVDFPVDVPNMKFTLPKQHTTPIQASEITKSRVVTFDITGDTSIFPFPQFRVNGVPFELSDIMYDLVLDGHAEEWILISTTNAMHPFHLHVLPFQVKSVKSGFNGTINMETVRMTESIAPDDMWRDTVVIPPYGMVRIWIRFETPALVDLNGKSVFHCHMLAHEDTGMITPIRFTDPNFQDENASEAEDGEEDFDDDGGESDTGAGSKSAPLNSNVEYSEVEIDNDSSSRFTINVFAATVTALLIPFLV